MTFTINRTTLLNALNICGKAVSRTNILPACNNFLFQFEKGKLTIFANDMRNVISTSIKVDTKEKLNIQVPAQKIMDLLKNLADQPLAFTIAEDFSIAIKSQSGSYKLPGSGDDFPLPSEEYLSETSIPAEDLKEAFYKTLFCCGSNAIKPAWDGPTFEFLGGKLRVTSVNGYSASTVLIDAETGLNHYVIIDKSSAEILSSLLEIGNVKIKFADNSIKFESDVFSFSAQVIGEDKPEVQGVLPDNKSVLTINKNELIGAIKRASMFANGVVKLSLTKSELIIYGEFAEFKTDASETIKCDFDGEDMAIGTICDQILPALQKCIPDVIYIAFSQPSRGFLIREENNFEKENLMLVMPIAVK